MLRQNSSNINWQFLLLGLFYIIMHCDARAVNVSNTWTMPQEGLNVFYRFFRDRISWFEADAVCQFHHANLVTVDNSFQFDATRDLLRELDVNDIVWIGLMRPQSSDRFMWSSNSRPLVADTGYWAESLPLMDAPLCAVIDPIRDYRWHALRCGGPETASFLCEMPVPSWADACNLKDMPNLTLQYMADTASIELIRNCQEEGLLRTMCRGKQDRERALQDLICPRERLEAQRINDITNSHFKSLQIINSIPTDNNENNDIELLPMEVNYGPHYPEELQTEKNTVQRLIEQFNVDELMQADEPSNMETVSSFYKIPGLIPKPVKKSAKKVLEQPKKESTKQKGVAVVQLQKDKKRLPIEMEEMMMGDQPQGEPEMPEQLLNEDVSNEILEPLPHIKKTNMYKEDMGKMEKEAIAMKENMQKAKEMEHKKMMMASTTKTMTKATKPTTTESSTSTSFATIPTIKHEISHDSQEFMHKHTHDVHTDLDTSSGHLTTTPPSATIGHPMHPQQPRSNNPTEESQHPHIKESTDNSHFIPPMLMVKSHYVPSSNKHGHNEQHHHMEHLETTTEELAETTIKHDQNHTMEMVLITTPKVEDLEKTTLKDLNTKPIQSETKIEAATIKSKEEDQVATDSGSIKPITKQPEQEKRQNSKNLNFQEVQTTMTITTLQPSSSAASPSSTTSRVVEETTFQTLTNEKDKNNSNDDDDNSDETQELKPQTTDTDTTQTTKLVETTITGTTEKLHDLETEHIKTETTPVEKLTTTQTTIEQPQEKEKHVTTELQKTEEHDEHKPAEEKVATTETVEVTTLIQTQTTFKPDTQNIQTETSVAQKKSLEDELENTQKTDEYKKETIKTTTDVLETSTTTILTPTTTSLSSSSTTTTTTTSVKPISTNTPQNVDDTTFATSTTTMSPTTSSTTTASPSTTFIPSSFTPTTTTTPPPETTTRNFLKVTTEEPFKPNRRRSLTKPETVSYMKKILG